MILGAGSAAEARPELRAMVPQVLAALQATAVGAEDAAIDEWLQAEFPSAGTGLLHLCAQAICGCAQGPFGTQEIGLHVDRLRLKDMTSPTDFIAEPRPAETLRNLLANSWSSLICFC